MGALSSWNVARGPGLQGVGYKVWGKGCWVRGLGSGVMGAQVWGARWGLQGCWVQAVGRGLVCSSCEVEPHIGSTKTHREGEHLLGTQEPRHMHQLAVFTMTDGLPNLCFFLYWLKAQMRHRGNRRHCIN